MDNITPVYPYEYVNITFITKPDNIIGSLLFYSEKYILNGRTLYPPNNTISFKITENPGNHKVYAYYQPDLASDSYYEGFGIKPSYKSNSYPRSEYSDYVTLTVLKVPVSLRSFNTTFDEDNDLYVTMNLSSMDNAFDEYYEGEINVYSEDTLIDSIDLDIFNDDNLENPSVINFTLDKQYNNKNLRFEFTDDFGYYDDLVFERLIDLEKNVTLTTTSNTIRANVADIVEIPYTFNDTVNDGKISISYGGSADNITDVTSSSGVIRFDTTDYLQGEYDLILKYYDSNVYGETSIPITLELYQPTTITADKSELNVVLGKGNEYTVNFETSLDSWDDVIWGSIDVYVDNNIIDTIIIDDTTGNTGSIVLDDYNLEDVSAGTHTLKAVFITDDPYISSSQTTVDLNVGGDVILELPENPVAMIKENFVMPVNITFNGKIINTGNITWYFENVDVRHANLTRGNHREFTRYINDNVGLYNKRQKKEKSKRTK